MSALLLSGGAGWAAEPPVAADRPLRGQPLNRSVEAVEKACSVRGDSDPRIFSGF